jgi:REP element-mobilizing transposase RayT
MTRSPRRDSPGAWHHIVNRGIARRVMFDDQADIRHFLALLAREHRRGRLELHAWCVLATHFHLLVRSPSGVLSTAMRHVQNSYSRFYNRRHRRDGPLVRGRFYSRTVDDDYDRRVVVRYIDENSVKARLASRPEEYRWGSAAQYMRDVGPGWLTRDWVESQVMELSRTSTYRPADYTRVFAGTEPRGDSPSPGVLRSNRADHECLVNLAPRAVREWMDFKSRLADGQKVGDAVVPSEVVRSFVRSRRKQGAWHECRFARRRDVWPLVETALLRTLCAETWVRIGEALGCSRSTSQDRFRRHQVLCRTNRSYFQRVEALAAEIEKYGTASDPPE